MSGSGLPNGVYILTEGRAWLEVGGFAVCVAKTDEGVSVDVFESGLEDGGSLVSCYAFDSELSGTERV